MLGSIREGLGVDIEAERALVVVEFCPFAAEGECATEVFSKGSGLCSVKVSVYETQKTGIFFWRLHRVSISRVLVKGSGSSFLHGVACHVASMVQKACFFISRVAFLINSRHFTSVGHATMEGRLLLENRGYDGDSRW